MRFVSVPKGMSSGFYAFMGAGSKRSDSGEILMLAPDRTEELKDYYRLQSEKGSIPDAHIAFLQKLKADGFNPAVTYDIGSNLLHWSKEARKLWPETRIIHFDGTSELEFLYREQGLEFFPVILSDEVKRVRWYANPRFPGGNSYYKENTVEFPADVYTTQTTDVLDLLVKACRLPLPDLVKIDVQGAEVDVLTGGKDTVKNCKRILAELQKVDYNAGAPKARDVLNYMSSIGFMCDSPVFCDNGPDADFSFIQVSNFLE